MRLHALLTVFSALSLVSAQNATRPSQSAVGAPSAHGLTLVLSRYDGPDPGDAYSLKTCLAHNPPIACEPLTLTLKNEGSETILSFGASCGGPEDIFEFQMTDGSWKTFPKYHVHGTVQVETCTATIAGYSPVLPGKSYSSIARLAHYLGTDALPDTAAPGDINEVTGFLKGAGSHTIRVTRSIYGCVVTGRAAGDAADEHVPLSCGVGERLADLRSNELRLSEKDIAILAPSTPESRK